MEKFLVFKSEETEEDTTSRGLSTRVEISVGKVSGKRGEHDLVIGQEEIDQLVLPKFSQTSLGRSLFASTGVICCWSTALCHDITKLFTWSKTVTRLTYILEDQTGTVRFEYVEPVLRAMDCGHLTVGGGANDVAPGIITLEFGFSDFVVAFSPIEEQTR